MTIFQTHGRCVGITHKVGNRKSDGKPYDFYKASFVLDDESYGLGQRAVELSVSDDVATTLLISRPYILLTHFFKGQEYCDGVLPCEVD